MKIKSFVLTVGITIFNICYGKLLASEVSEFPYIAQFVAKELCVENNIYLRCLDISEQQCKSEVISFASECEQEFYLSESVPKEYDDGTNDYISCIIYRHLDSGLLNERESAKSCLNDTPKNRQFIIKRKLRLKEKYFGGDIE